jgi:putative spermidine/putrescine transport system substrate-binding protein
MWGGNQAINQYMDGYVANELKKRYGITLKRVPMNAPEYLTKLINEKKSGISIGTGDILWINAENFLTAKTANLLDGPFDHLLPNQSKYYDLNALDLSFDSGIPIEGYEAIWGRAQLVLSYDASVVKNPPKSYEALLQWAEDHPGKFTFPKIPDDFVGTAFLRNSYYELTGEKAIFLEEMSEDTFEEISKPVTDYFLKLKPHLWNEGKNFPSTQAQLDEMFKNGEIYMTMGFEIGKTAGLISRGVYPKTVETYVFDTGTIGNSHYLAIPYNAKEPAGALLVINFLQSPEAQFEKMKADVWGDMPAFDVNKLSEEMKNDIEEIEKKEGALTLELLNEKRLQEMNAQLIEWIKTLWIEEIIQP